MAEKVSMKKVRYHHPSVMKDQGLVECVTQGFSPEKSALPVAPALACRDEKG